MYQPVRTAEGAAAGTLDPTPRVNWWLRLTSSGWEQPAVTIEQREHARRSRLASWIILGLLIAVLVLIPTALFTPGTLVALVGVGVGLLIMAALNRAGQVSAAGVLLILLVCAGVISSIASDPRGLTIDALPGYDLLAVSIVVGASVLPRRATFGVAAFNIAVICLDFFLQPHAPDLVKEYAQFSGQTEAALVLLARPVALQIILAVIAFLWVRGTDQAIRRADRAEEIAALEHSIADQKRQLDIGIQQILQTHIRAANGDFTARAPLGQENVLWQIAASLNNLLARLQRAGQAEHQLRRTEEELARLAAAIDDAQSGRRPIWPAPSGTAADLIIERVNRGANPPTRISRPSDRIPSEPLTPSAAPPSQGFGAPPSQGFGVPPLPPLGGPAGPSEPLLDEWERQQTERVPTNPWVFPPEAEEHP